MPKRSTILPATPFPHASKPGVGALVSNVRNVHVCKKVADQLRCGMTSRFHREAVDHKQIFGAISFSQWRLDRMKKRIAINRNAWIMWTIGVVALLAGTVVTFLVLDSAVSIGKFAALAVLWLVLLAFAYEALKVPVYSAFLEPGGVVSFVWQYPHKRIRKSCPVSGIPEPHISTSVDSDGDRQFAARLLFPDGAEFILAQPVVRTFQTSNSEARNLLQCERSCARFVEAISRSEAR
jgi:hypothetical protein